VTVVGTLLAPLYKRLNKLESAGFLTSVPAPELLTSMPSMLTRPTTVVIATASGTFTLPTAQSSYAGYILAVSNASGGSSVTVQGGFTSITLVNGRGVTFFCTGTQWRATS
jgi:hypothetical protein